MSRVDPADARSLALHKAVAEKIRCDPGLVARARERVARWRATGDAHAHYCEAWDEILARPLPQIVAFLESDDEHSRELRQVSPFAGVLDARERWRVLRETRTGP